MVPQWQLDFIEPMKMQNLKFSVDSVGIVKVYEYDSSAHIWTRKGQNILGRIGVSKFGYRLAMSANGTRLAISS